MWGTRARNERGATGSTFPLLDTTELKFSRTTSATATRAVDPLPLMKTRTAVSTRAAPTMSHSLRPSAVAIPSSFYRALPAGQKTAF